MSQDAMQTLILLAVGGVTIFALWKTTAAAASSGKVSGGAPRATAPQLTAQGQNFLTPNGQQLAQSYGATADRDDADAGNSMRAFLP